MKNKKETITLYSYYELGVSVAQLTMQAGLQTLNHPYFGQKTFGDTIKSFIDIVSSRMQRLGVEYMIDVESITAVTADEFAGKIGDAFVEPLRYEKKYAYTLGQNMILWTLGSVAILGSTPEAEMINLQREILLALKALDIRDESIEQFFEEVSGYSTVEDYINGIRYFSRMMEVFLSKVIVPGEEIIKRGKNYECEYDYDYDYDVAFSFAGEDRAYVGEVAKILNENGVSVFYDEYEKIKLWGKDLYIYLDDLYTNRSKYCVVFVSKYYLEKKWTIHELKSIFVRAFSNKSEYMLPARFDNTIIKGIRETLGYIDLREYSPDEFADIIIGKLRQDYNMQ